MSSSAPAPGSANTPAAPPARQRILQAAGKLFYAHGVQAVGVDRVVASADVAKMSLYKHFKSKDDLVEAWLAQRDAWWFDWCEASVKRHAPAGGRARLLAVFDALEEWFLTPEYRGCAFINIASELSDTASPARRIAVEHTKRLGDLIHEWTIEAGEPDPIGTSMALTLLVEGAIVWAAMHNKPETARRAKRAAERVLGAAG
ncbi:MAG: TetR/AcrR family transcriptional regulator [Phycisphaerales bacterium]